MLEKKYAEVRQRTLDLCSPLQLEDYNLQAAIFVSPPKWHLAHTTWFFEEFILKNHYPNYQLFNTDFGVLFNSYYETIGKRIARDQRGLISRPSLDQVEAYRAYVDQHMVQLLESDKANEIEELCTLGINHEEQHQELLKTDIKYSLSQSPLYPVLNENLNLCDDHNQEEGWVNIKEGTYTIGHDGLRFCYDNELGQHKVYLHAASISKALVTNGEYLAFIEDGGYQRFEFWLEEAWAWVNSEQITQPLYWVEQDGKWHQYTLAGLKPLDNEAILSHISYYEAWAFAKWKGMRLPTEFEWEAAADQLDWGKRWEITNSHYSPYPGFEIKEGAVGEYNGKFMINQMVMRGASVATSPNHSRKTYRNFFHPSMRWQYSGIRLAKDIHS